jgi:hypothetical protein
MKMNKILQIIILIIITRLFKNKVHINFIFHKIIIWMAWANKAMKIIIILKLIKIFYCIQINKKVKEF